MIIPIKDAGFRDNAFINWSLFWYIDNILISFKVTIYYAYSIAYFKKLVKGDIKWDARLVRLYDTFI